jgi:membrane-associated protease RseP (regulator of RpoE activity)
MLLGLSKDIIRHPKDWVFIIEGLPMYRKAGSRIPYADIAVADKLSSDLSIPVHDIIPSQGDPEILSLVALETGIPQNDVVAMVLYPILSEQIGMAARQMPANASPAAQADAVIKRFDAGVRALSYRHGIKVGSLRNIIFKTAADISASDEVFEKFIKNTQLVRDKMREVRNRVARERFKAIIDSNLGKNVLALAGIAHAAIFSEDIYSESELAPASRINSGDVKAFTKIVNAISAASGGGAVTKPLKMLTPFMDHGWRKIVRALFIAPLLEEPFYRWFLPEIEKAMTSPRSSSPP